MVQACCDTFFRAHSTGMEKLVDAVSLTLPGLTCKLMRVPFYNIVVGNLYATVEGRTFHRFHR